MVAVYPEQVVESNARERIWDTVAIGLLGLLSLSYLISAIRTAAIRSPWMDEILAVWTARLPSVDAIWRALEKGSDFSPPVYALFLHGIIGLGGDSYLILRLPSILAVFIVGVAAFILVRRRYPVPIAAVAMALCLTGGLYSFALEVRQYALVAACLALTLVIWDVPAERLPSWRGALTMLVLLVAAVGMHFYAVLMVGSVGLMELAWTMAHRRIRPLYIAVIALAGLSVLLWLPIMQNVVAFTHGDNLASAYYARPRPESLLADYAALMVGHRPIWLSPLVLFELAVLANALMAIRRVTVRTHRCAAPDNLDIVVAATCAIPVLVFVFALTLTNTFNLRYTVLAAFGLAILTSRLVARLPRAPLLCGSLLVVAIMVSFTPDMAAESAALRNRVLGLIVSAPPKLPVATGDGLRFFEVREGAPHAVAQRLVFIMTPPGVASPDPTNEHQVERWKSVAPDLPVESLRSFLTFNSRFLVFSDCTDVDLLPQLLARRGYRLEVIARTGCAKLLEAEGRTGD